MRQKPPFAERVRTVLFIRCRRYTVFLLHSREQDFPELRNHRAHRGRHNFGDENFSL